MSKKIYIVAGERNIQAARSGLVDLRVGRSGLWANVGQTTHAVKDRLRDVDYARKAGGGEWVIIFQQIVGDLIDDRRHIHPALKRHPLVYWNPESSNTEEFFFKGDAGDGSVARDILNEILTPLSMPYLKSENVRLNSEIARLNAEIKRARAEIESTREGINKSKRDITNYAQICALFALFVGSCAGHEFSSARWESALKDDQTGLCPPGGDCDLNASDVAKSLKSQNLIINQLIPENQRLRAEILETSLKEDLRDPRLKSLSSDERSAYEELYRMFGRQQAEDYLASSLARRR